MASRSAPVARRIVGVCMLQLLPQRQRGERRQRAEAERELAEQPLARAAEQPRSGEGAEDVDRQQGQGLVQRSEEHTSELQSLMRISYAVFCLKKKKKRIFTTQTQQNTTK